MACVLAAEPRHEIPVADRGERLLSHVLRFGERAADGRRDAEEREERGGDRLLRDHLGRLSARAVTLSHGRRG